MYPQMQGTGKAKVAKQEKTNNNVSTVSVQYLHVQVQLFSGIDDIRDRSLLILKTIRRPEKNAKQRSGNRRDWPWMEII